MLCEASIEIERPIDQVFEAVTRRHGYVMPSDMPHSGMESDAPVHVGSTFTWEQDFVGQTYPFKVVITEVEPPHFFTLKMINGPTYNSRYTFMPTQRGTLFHRVVEVEVLSTPWQGMIDEQLAKTGLVKMLNLENEQLKMWLENEKMIDGT